MSMLPPWSAAEMRAVMRRSHKTALYKVRNRSVSREAFLAWRNKAPKYQVISDSEMKEFTLRLSQSSSAAGIVAGSTVEARRGKVLWLPD